MTRAIPELLLERYRLNELPPAARAAIAREAAADAVIRARLDALAASDNEIREQYPAAVLTRRVVRRPRRARGLMLAGALTAAVIALVSAIPRTIVPAVEEETRMKGAGRPALAVYRRTAAGSERLADGDLARPGDLLRIGYTSAGRAYGVILSIDGKGAVTQHLPPSGAFAASLAPGAVTLLDSAYELDEAPRIERFYFITGTRPFAVAPVLDAARRASGAPPALPLPAGLDQVSFAVQKEVRQ